MIIDTSRSIPACTGKPPVVQFLLILVQVYPRVYGETTATAAPARSRPGLSPRVRGNPGQRLRRPIEQRSIPACTGKPLSYHPRAQGYRVYPRVYGETCSTLGPATPEHGLSPRVRGNPRPLLISTQCHRSIPACTGKPRTISVPCAASTVYPRVYGETVFWVDFASSVEGLSPRVRGNPKYDPINSQSPRSIPACTGKPETWCWSSSNGGVYPRVYGETPKMIHDCLFALQGTERND